MLEQKTHLVKQQKVLKIYDEGSHAASLLRNSQKSERTTGSGQGKQKLKQKNPPNITYKYKIFSPSISKTVKF